MREDPESMTQTYSFQVDLSIEHQMNEWSGTLTLFTEADGEISVDLSIEDLPVVIAQ